jgi:alpha-beta hydrolase superfamily lysophospholipase
VPGVLTGAVTSADGTRIGYERSGAGPAVIFVHGAMSDRTFPVLAGLAAALAPELTVFNYDRRGRGDSGDTAPYAVRREIEDIDALIQEAGGSAMVFGGSSGAALALEAAAAGLAISRLALWEPPYHVDDTAPPLPDDFGSQLDDLVRAGRPGDAVALFMTKAAEMPADQVAWMRAQPSWAEAEAVGHTLAYEAAVMGPGNALPAGRLASVRAPTLVLNGGDSPAWMTNAGRAVAATVPGATQRILEGQSHNPAPESLAPELLGFFAAR